MSGKFRKFWHGHGNRQNSVVNPPTSEELPKENEAVEELARIKQSNLDISELEDQISSQIIEMRKKLFQKSKCHNCHKAPQGVPYEGYDCPKVTTLCENVIGYTQVPLGFAGPLLLNGVKHIVPMATTEGCLVASTNRGCRALVDGVQCIAHDKRMTRSLIMRMPNSLQTTTVHNWLKNSKNLGKLQEIVESVSGFVKLLSVTGQPIGRLLQLHLVLNGDAILISQGTDKGLKFLQNTFADMEIVVGNDVGNERVSPSNWAQDGCYCVVAEAVVPGHALETILKVKASQMVELHVAKNIIGTSMAGSVAGCNAHAANIVAAIYLATGQDLAKLVKSSRCVTLMELSGENNDDLYVSVTMPSIEFGVTPGGLNGQEACVRLMGLNDPLVEPQENILVRLVGGTVLAGELSLMAALATETLVDSHLKLNRRI